MAAKSLAVVDVLIDEQKLVRSDAANGDGFGTSVAIDGNYCVAGAAYDNFMGTESGSVQVFFYNGTTWEFVQKLMASDGAEGDRFGNSVSIAGQVIVVGAPWGDDDTASSSGAVYVFRRDGDSWVEEAKLTASDAAEDDRFGYCVSTDGDRIIVGADRDEGNALLSAGAAYVFAWNGASWVQEQKLTASDGANADHFGYSVAVDGTRAIVGAYGDDDSGWDSGSAYIFSWNGSAWVEEEKLIPSEAGEHNFGFSVSIDGNRASTAGGEAVYIFSWNGSDWLEEAKLTPSEGADGLFGTSLSMDGENVIVGARGADDRGTDSGAVYIFSFDGTHWVEANRLLADDGTEADRFGISVAIDGAQFLVGASGDDTTNGEDAGSVYVYALDAGQWLYQRKLTAWSYAPGANFGNSVCVDGDTAIIGAHSDKENGSQSGAAYIFDWNGSKWVEAAKLKAPDAAPADLFGISVSLSEGRAIVGAWGDDDRGTNSGSAYIFFDNGSSWVQQVKLTASDGTAGDYFGHCVSVDGDWAVVGAHCDDDKGTDSGSAYIFRWEGSSWVQEAKLTASDGAMFDNFGLSVSIDADTVIVGAPDVDDGYLMDRGAAYVFVRTGTAWTQQATLKVAGTETRCLGLSVSISGDKAVIGGDSYSPAYIFARTASTWTQQAKLLGSDDDPGLGAVCISGNVVLTSDSSSVPGAVYAFVKRGANWVEVDKIISPSDGPSSGRFGWAVSISDNRCMVGAPWDVENGTSAGAVHAYTWCTPGDLSGDCKVDMEDVAILGLHWLDGK